MIGIIISCVALLVSILAYLKAFKLKFKYEGKSITFYDKTGKNILIIGSSTK